MTQSLATFTDPILVESTPVDSFTQKVFELTHAVYPYDQVFGEYCTVHEFIDAPPEFVFEYMSRTTSLNEWTYSVRKLKESPSNPGLFEGVDQVGEEFTKLFCRTLANREALTIDYHCAWDQGQKLWMIYLNRLVSAQTVLGKPGTVLIWTNCKHPNYDKNPHPELAPHSRPVWVGEMWPYFYAGHSIEAHNLKLIVEKKYRDQNRDPHL